MKKIVLIFFLFISTASFSQSYKYTFEKAIITLSVESNGVYKMILDSNVGEQVYYYRYKETDNDMYVYELIKYNDIEMSEFQRSQNHIKSRTKFSDLCKGLGGKVLMTSLGKSEIVEFIP